jgi:hypothetical protein
MADLYSIYGAIELCEKQLSMLKRLVEANEDANPHVESWLFHENGGWGCYAFFGHTVKVSALAKVRAQLQRIAKSIQTKDPDVEWVDFVEGRFWAVYDREPCYEWVLKNGEFLEHQHA